jgi:hypothetical protein
MRRPRSAAPDAATDAAPIGPAYYARSRILRNRRLGEWWTLLHPPYTLWHLSYVVIGACLLGPVSVSHLVATLLAFFLAVGVAAHALDELRGRPLRTTIPAWQLIVASVLGLGGATGLGIAGAVVVGPALAAFIVVGLVLALGYNLELFGGRLHSDTVFAAGWGAFPVLTAYAAQHNALSIAALLAATFAMATSAAQRQLSTPARALRRRTSSVEGVIADADGQRTEITSASLLAPLEGSLKWLSVSMVALAIATALARLHPFS